ncbi:MAG: NAD-glutamate dehydrogenase [Pseudomonadota bacterium]
MSESYTATVRRPTDIMTGVLEEIVAHAVTLASGFTLPPAIDVPSFVHRYYENAAPDDLRETDPEQLAAAALAHLQYVTHRRGQDPKFRVYAPNRTEHGWTTPAPRLVVELISDDMPFLVSTLALAVQQCGLSLRMTVHPVYEVERTAEGELLRFVSEEEDPPAGSRRESLVHMQLDRDADTRQLVTLLASISEGVGDLRLSIDDWRAMRDRLMDARDGLTSEAPPVPDQILQESLAFLQWMNRRNFTFLGYREYRLKDLDGAETLVPIESTGLGILRPDSRLSHRPPEFARVLRHHLRSREPLIITKADTVSTIHRTGRLDYIGVKQYDPAGRVIGEHRFLGLFTASVYYTDALAIPLVRLKMEQILQRAELTRASHAGRTLLHVLQTHPRDELLQASIEDLSRIANSIRNLQERQLTRLFIRRDLFRRFIACLVFIPREKFNTLVREKLETLMLEGLGGESLESQVTLSESALARVYTVVRIDPKQDGKIQLRWLQDHIEQVAKTWDDHLREALSERYGERRGIALTRRFASAFPAAYTEEAGAQTAADDIERMLALDSSKRNVDITLYRPADAPRQHVHLKLIRPFSPISLSNVLPALENLALHVVSERPYKLELDDGKTCVWIQDFDMRCREAPERIEDVQDVFRDAARAIWRGAAENDGFNALVLRARLSWRDAALLRAYCRYLLQTGLPFSQSYMEEVLGEYAQLAGSLVALFHARLDPAGQDDGAAAEHARTIEKALDGIASADEDRIVRAFYAVVMATLRTNVYQRNEDGKPPEYMSFKLDPAQIPDLPEPRPMFEIFVYSPRVEGVHLRTSKVARGGLRWSDRREDFRTEILGLMKAQKVKNTVIVPTGAKGGFVAKRLPEGDREAIMTEGVACYRLFIRGLLDLTDNIVGGEIVPPEDTVCLDEPDSYLVVAADKGTETFSDIANEVATSYGFWLGDAFASGGSVGYDHKKMGITARGAWEAVKRHFREDGVDTQGGPFTVAAIGDMSGDVFGNGMLLSPHIRLQAAFNHLHIFLDPNPDAARSYAERDRLFRLPRSTWEDYDASLISAGGGVFSRRSKSIRLPSEARAMLDLQEEELTPNALISAILKMRVQLLWNGGIGTYVKASDESHDEAGDRTNDAVRVNARDLRCKVVGEGGNLGLTQRARIEFAHTGGFINTDFIDNAGGVDCSDHEVNIKILLDLLVKEGEVSCSQRESVLAQMTDEVSALVLESNYRQTQAISLTELIASERFREHVHLMRSLERERELSRALEFLPDEEEVTARNKLGRGLTRPELSVLVSYAKMHLYGALIDSTAPEDPHLAGDLKAYFPSQLVELAGPRLTEHPLAREIIATQVTNDLINRMGPTFAHRTMDDTGADAGAVAQAYAAALFSLDLRPVWSAIERLDNKTHAATQYAMLLTITRVLRQSTYWLLERQRGELDIGRIIDRYHQGVRAVRETLPEVLTDSERYAYDEAVQGYERLDVPTQTARAMAALGPLPCAFDIVDIATEANMDVGAMSELYFQVGGLAGADWLRDAVEQLHIAGRWQAIARQSLRDTVYALQAELVRHVVVNCGGDRLPCASALEQWGSRNRAGLTRVQRIINEITESGEPDFSTLTVAAQEIRKLARL